MKSMYGSTDSVTVSSPESNHGDSCEFTLQRRNEITEDDDSRSQDHLKSLYGSSNPNGWTSDFFCNLDPEQGQYHLPRSSHVISRKSRFQASEVFSRGFPNTQELPVTVPTNDEQGSSESPSPLKIRGVSLSDGMVQHLNRSPRPGNKNRASSDTHLGDTHSGPVNEKQISEDLYRNSMDLDQENAHFAVVDMVLEVLEAFKWAVSQQNLKHTEGSEDTDEHRKSKTNSSTFSDSGYDDYCGHKLSSDRSSQTSKHRSLKMSRCSAEGLAQHLLTELMKQCGLSEQPFSCDKTGLALEEFPSDTVSMVTRRGVELSEEIRMRSRMRGTLTWAPPRFQIIFSVQPTQRRSDIIASQHFLCAGCGTEVEPRYIKRLRYCEYLGRYFCDGCHSGGESVIPGRVLSRWDFGRYPVCSFSKQLLDSIWEQPLFKLSVVAKNLYGQAKELQRFRVCEQAGSIRVR